MGSRGGGARRRVGLAGPRRRTSKTPRLMSDGVPAVVVRTGELDPVRHLRQTAAQARADALLERLFLRIAAVVVVRGENGGALFVVARVDDVVEDVLHEL